jgi:hypothetical protein
MVLKWQLAIATVDRKSGARKAAVVMAARRNQNARAACFWSPIS